MAKDAKKDINKKTSAKKDTGAVKRINGRRFDENGKLVFKVEDIKKLEDQVRRKKIREHRKWRVTGVFYPSDLENGYPKEWLPKESIESFEGKYKDVIRVNIDDLTADDQEDITTSLEKQFKNAYGMDLKKSKPLIKKVLKNLKWMYNFSFIPDEDFEFVLKVFRFNNGRSFVRKTWQPVIIIRYLQDPGLGISQEEGIANIVCPLKKSNYPKLAISDVTMKTDQDTWYLDHIIIVNRDIYEFLSPSLDYKKQPKPKKYITITKHGQVRLKKDRKAEKEEDKDIDSESKEATKESEPKKDDK